MAIEKLIGKLNKSEGGFTTILNRIVQNIGSLEAVGLYCYLATMPRDWTINIKQIMNHFSIGKEKAYKVFNQLLELDLITKIEHRDQGKFVCNEYILHIDIGFQPYPEKPDTAKPDPANQDTYKTNNKQNKYNTNTISESDDSPAIPNSINIKEIVNISNEVCSEWPKIVKIDDKLKTKIIRMMNDWPSYADSLFTLEQWTGFLLMLKKHHKWMFQPYTKPSGKLGKWSLRTLVQPTQLAKIRNNEYF